MSNPQFPKKPESALTKAVAQRMLRKQNVQVGESYAIKGDAHIIADLEATVQGQAEKKLKQADLEAKRMIEAAKQEARQEAHRIIAEAKQKAEATAQQIVADAEAQRDAVREQAHSEGYEAGLAEGYYEAVEKVELGTKQLLETAQTIMDGAYRAEKFVLEHFQQDALALVRHISQKVLKTEIEQTPEHIARLIDQAIESLYLTGRVKVVLGKKYLDMVRGFTPNTEALVESMKRFEWVGDPLMTQHEIHVLSSEGSFAVGPDIQIERVLEPLQNSLPLFEAPILEHPPQPETITFKDMVPKSTKTTLDVMPPISMPQFEMAEEADALLLQEQSLRENEISAQVQNFESTAPVTDVDSGLLDEASEFKEISLTGESLPEALPWEPAELDDLSPELNEGNPIIKEGDLTEEAVAVDFPDLEDLMQENQAENIQPMHLPDFSDLLDEGEEK